MKLNLIATSQSITSLVADELPDFAIVTGLNGSGKTHFLRGIENGSVGVDGVAKDIGAKARFFDYNTIAPKNTGIFSSQTIRGMRQNTLVNLSTFQSEARGNLRSALDGIINQVKLTSPSFNLDDPFSLLGTQTNKESYPEVSLADFDQLRAAAQLSMGQLTREENLLRFGLSQGLVKYCDQIGVSMAHLKAEDLAETAIDLWGAVDVFQQNLGQIFVAYRDMYLRNRLKKLDDCDGKAAIPTAISKETFLATYGESPWDFVNQILENAQLPFRINEPDGNDYADFTPELTKTTSNVKIPFVNLSSGEKVLMSFALCLYQARDARQAVTFPEILLLDEIDAPLHPSMVKNLISTINDVLVTEKKIKVIMTTHSPTTVAIAPEESIFVMEEGHRVCKASKDAALKLLTYGVPTLSISFNGRRQVFVESRNDAFLYEELYKCLTSHISSEKSLVFIAASGQTKCSDTANENGGSSVVTALVGMLAKAGNSSVYGLIDWDKTNVGSDRVKVLAKDRRYALETCVLDPALLVFLITHKSIKEAKNLNLIKDSESYMTLANLTENRMQEAVNVLTDKLGYTGEKAECEYLGGARLRLVKDMMQDNGHTYAEKILSTFPFLRAIKGSGNAETCLMDYIVKNVVVDARQWLPKELQQAFEGLVAE